MEKPGDDEPKPTKASEAEVAAYLANVRRRKRRIADAEPAP